MTNLIDFIKNLFGFNSETKQTSDVSINETKNNNNPIVNLNQVTLIDDGTISPINVAPKLEGKPKKKYYKKRTPKSSDKDSDNSEKPKSSNKKSKNID